MMYVQIAATTNHIALTVSPLRKAMIAHATAPSSATMPKMILWRVVIGERSMTTTGGSSGSVRMYVTSPSICSRGLEGAAVGDAMT